MLEEYLSWCQVSKPLSRAVIQSLHCHVDFLLRDGGEVPALREVLPDRHAGLLGPADECLAQEFRAIVGAQHLR